MLNLTPQHIIKYLSVALIVAVILYIIPGEKLEMNYIILVSMSAAIFSFILDLLSKWYIDGQRSEGMEETQEYGSNETKVVPRQFVTTTEEQDYANTGLNYDNDLPGYYLINNGKYSDNGRIPYSESDELIEASKLHDLYEQHNFHILSSPHTHIGKSRGNLTWEPTYN
jgi:hypothetical protein